MLSPQPPGPQHVAVFEDRVLQEELKVKSDYTGLASL